MHIASISHNEQQYSPVAPYNTNYRSNVWKTPIFAVAGGLAEAKPYPTSAAPEMPPGPPPNLKPYPTSRGWARSKKTHKNT